MLPHLGAGAGQAIEDAYILSILLSHPQTTKLNVEVIRFYLKYHRSLIFFPLIVGFEGI